MRYPKKSQGALKEKLLPALSGGINLSDGADMADNELKSALNMWYNEGLLRTRPGLAELSRFGIKVTGEVVKTDFKQFRDITLLGRCLAALSVVTRAQRLKGEQDIAVLTQEDSQYETVLMQTVYFWWQGEDDIVALPQIMLDSVDADGLSFFACEAGQRLYCFFSNREIYSLDPDTENGWAMVPQSEMYAPLMYVAGAPDNSGGINFVQFESRNLLTPYYRCAFSAVNPEIETSTLYWRLPKALPSNKKGIITARFTDTAGNTTTHTVTLGEGEVFFEKENSGGVFLFVKSDSTFGFSTERESVTPAVMQMSQYKADNITLTALSDFDTEGADRVFQNTVACSFCGSALSERGANRLFLAGNTLRENAADVVWSGLDNPLYFPENCYFRVGNSAEGIKALGRFEDKLIIFKANEIYYTYSAENTITAEDILDSRTLDYTALSVYFPLVSLNSRIGCDCPESILLCRNRLVFAHSSGSIFTLISTDRYSAMQVYKLSATAEPMLKDSRESLKNAVAADYCGHYVLCSSDRIYALNYTSHGFVYISSLSKQSTPRVPIFVWELSQRAKGYMAAGQSVAALYVNKSDQGLLVDVGILKKDSIHDIGFDAKTRQLKAVTVKSEITTKAFALGNRFARKNVNKVCLCLACSSAAVVRFQDDRGSSVGAIYPAADSSADIAHPRPQIFLSPLRQAVTMSISIESLGAWGLESISIIYT